MMRFTNPILGAIVNCFIFGSADVFVGEIARGILKCIMSWACYIAAGLIVDRTDPQVLSDWLSVALILVFAIVPPVDGYYTVVKANGRQAH